MEAAAAIKILKEAVPAVRRVRRSRRMRRLTAETVTLITSDAFEEIPAKDRPEWMLQQIAEIKPGRRATVEQRTKALLAVHRALEALAVV